MNRLVAIALALCMAVGMLQYALPARRIIIATQSTYIRKDWLEALNMAVPTNIDELYAYLKAVKDANLGGGKTIPFSPDLYAADPFYGWIYQTDAFIDYSQVTEEDWIAYHDFHYLLPGASWITCDAFKPETGTTPHETYTAAGQCLFIPSWVDEETAQAAIKYLNWMCQPESLYALQNGLEGHNYTTKDENGIPTDLKNINDTEDAYKMHATDGAPICNGFDYGSDELNDAASANAYPGYSDVVADSLVIVNDGGYQPASFTKTIQARVDYGSTVISKEAELLAQTVTCAPGDFDAKWDEYTKAILDVGGQQIIDEQRAAYQEGAYRGFYPKAE